MSGRQNAGTSVDALAAGPDVLGDDFFSAGTGAIGQARPQNDQA